MSVIGKVSRCALIASVDANVREEFKFPPLLHDAAVRDRLYCHGTRYKVVSCLGADAEDEPVLQGVMAGRN